MKAPTQAATLPTLKVYSKNVYGKIRIYPNCDITKAIVRITGDKTLTMRDIETLSEVGFDVEVKPKS